MDLDTRCNKRLLGGCSIHLSTQLQVSSSITQSKFWDKEAPSKLLVFSCEQLRKMNIQIQNLEASCYFCNSRKETTQHLFLMCPETIHIWQGIFRWLGTDIVFPQEIYQLYDQFGLFIRGRKCRRWKHLIWHAACWCLWKIRNGIAFRRELFDGAKLLEEIKIIS